MREWFISGGIHFVLGFVVGWLVFQRPQFVTDLINKLRAKIGV